MTDRSPSIAPADVAETVESYVTKARDDAEKYENSSLLDDSGVWSLHKLVADAYARGFDDGSRAESVRARGTRLFDRRIAKARIAELEAELEAVRNA